MESGKKAVAEEPDRARYPRPGKHEIDMRTQAGTLDSKQDHERRRLFDTVSRVGSKIAHLRTLFDQISNMMPSGIMSRDKRGPFHAHKEETICQPGTLFLVELEKRESFAAVLLRFTE
jgi:hypothetical protein